MEEETEEGELEQGDEYDMEKWNPIVPLKAVSTLNQEEMLSCYLSSLKIIPKTEWWDEGEKEQTMKHCSSLSHNKQKSEFLVYPSYSSHFKEDLISNFIEHPLPYEKEAKRERRNEMDESGKI